MAAGDKRLRSFGKRLHGLGDLPKPSGKGYHPRTRVYAADRTGPLGSHPCRLRCAAGTALGDPAPLLPHLGHGVRPAPPIPYSTDPASLFVAEVRAVYQAKAALTPEQGDIAHFWADGPGRDRHARRSLGNACGVQGDLSNFLSGG